MIQLMAKLEAQRSHLVFLSSNYIFILNNVTFRRRKNLDILKFYINFIDQYLMSTTLMDYK